MIGRTTGGNLLRAAPVPALAHVSRMRASGLDGLPSVERLGDAALSGVARVAAHLAGAETAAVQLAEGVRWRTLGSTGSNLATEPAVLDACQSVLDSGMPLFTADATRDPRFAGLPLANGGAVRFFAAFPLKSSGGETVGVLCALDVESRQMSAVVVQRLLDLAEQAEAQLELRSLAIELGRAATLDPLTGLVNRAVFEDRLGNALARAKRHRRVVFMAMLDIDDFRLINERIGHAAGDELLRLVARRLREVAREEDTIGRLGGDEFGLLTDVSLAGAQRLQQRLEGAFTGVLEGRSKATVTLGMALAQAGDDPRVALTHVDRAMDAAKRHPRRGGVRAVFLDGRHKG